MQADPANTAANADLLVVRDVCKHYGDHNVQALQNVSLTIKQGQFLALMGPSGCGKSTLLNCIGGLDSVTSGQIIIDGRDIAQLSEQQLTLLRRERIGFIFQFFNLLSTLNVIENVQLPLELDAGGQRTASAGGKSVGGQTITQKATSLLQQMGLCERMNFYPSQLSGGEMQRVAIARAIVHGPSVILADEPTGNLDTVNGTAVLELLQNLCREQGQTILMATHSAEAAQYADRTVHMKDGRIVGTGE